MLVSFFCQPLRFSKFLAPIASRMILQDKNNSPLHPLSVSFHRAAKEALAGTMGQILSQLLAIFYTKKLDIVVIGLENR